MKRHSRPSLGVFRYLGFHALALCLAGCDTDNLLVISDDQGNKASAEAGVLAEGDYRGGQCSDCYPGSEQFGELTYNGFIYAAEDNLSTFGIDVDKGSYTFGRKKINEGQLPPPASVRVEEYINYFRQDYQPPPQAPFSVSVDGAPSPFRSDSLHLLRIGLQGREPAEGESQPWNLTFLVDISGSMTSRMDLVKGSLFILVDNMRDGDQISICTYAGGVRTVLTPTPLAEIGKESIKGIISELQSGGSTAMASGLQNAYNVNMSGFLHEGVNRIIVCSDGDANVGAVRHEEILELIASYVAEGITLSTLGFGQGNYNDLLMEQLADKGNGNYYYIDSLAESERLFTEELIAMMEVIAKDVKIQVEFDPYKVIRYRLIGYENRAIADEDFEDEETDAGEIGAGHRVTALYELELSNNPMGHLLTVHLRYKLPRGTADIALDVPVARSDLAETFYAASRRFQFTAAVAEYAELLRGSPYVTTTLADVESLAAQTLWGDDDRDVEFLELVRKAQTIE